MRFLNLNLLACIASVWLHDHVTFHWYGMQDLTIKQRYLVTFTVGYDQRKNIDTVLKKVSCLPHFFSSLVLLLIAWLYISQFSDNFSIMLFHYDGRASEWEEFGWSKRAIHVSIRKQTKWLASYFLSRIANLPPSRRFYVLTDLLNNLLIFPEGGTPSDFFILT